MNILLALILIGLSVSELIQGYRHYQRKLELDLLLNGETIKSTTKKTKNKNVAFEKIVARNSAFIDFLRRFQEVQLWKVYAVVTVFSVFFIINQFMHFVAVEQDTLLIFLIAIIAFVIIVPEKVVKSQTEKRIRGVSKDLPLVIDIMAIMVKSGMTIENGFDYLSKKVKPINEDIATILERACVMMNVNGINAAIELIYREVPSKEVRMFCATLERSINYGNSIYDSLLELSSEMREMQKLEIEEKIAAVSAKMTAPMMIFILFPVLVVIGGPVIMRLIGMF